MPSLATALGVTTSALYHYFPNKQALLDALADEVLAGFELPSTGDLDWRSWLRAVAVAWRQLLIDTGPLPPRPTAATRAVGTRMLDGTFEVLLREGFTPEVARDAYEAVIACAFFWAFMAQADARDFRLSESGLRALIDEQAGELQHPDEIVTYMAGYDPSERFPVALDLLLDGIATWRGRDERRPT